MIALLIASLILVIIFPGTSLAQCDTSITIFYDDFGAGGDGTNCFSSRTAANMTLIPNPRINNSSDKPYDGKYSVICDGAGSGFGQDWLWHDVFTDHTPGDVNGNMVVINDGNDNDFCKKTLTQLCGGKNYTVTFYAANLADLDVNGNCGVMDNLPEISAGAYYVGTRTAINKTSPVTMAATRDLTWIAFTLNFTLPEDQTSIDIILHDTESADCGNDFAFDDFKVVGPTSRIPITIPKPPAEIPSTPNSSVVIPLKPKPPVVIQPEPKPFKKDTATQIADFKKDISIDEIKLDQKLQLSHIYFERAKYNLLETSLAELNDLATFMKKYPTVRIRLEGHTDNQGDPKVNVELSENRAKEVKKYLVEQGIEDTRIEWIGYGGQRPANSNDAEELRQKNRRVEVVIIGK